MATLVDCVGFEHGLIGVSGNWFSVFNGTPAIDNTRPRTGSFSLHIVTVATENVGRTIASQTVVCSFFLNIDTLASGDHEVAHFENSNGDVQIRFNQSSGRLALVDAATTETDFGPVLAADTWYLIDVSLTQAGGVLTYRARVDGDATTEGINTRSQGAANFTEWRLGTVSDGADAAMFYDDFVLSHTGADYPLGPYAVEGLRLTADGSHNIATSGDYDGGTSGANPFSNSTTDGNTYINESPFSTTVGDGSIIRQELGTTSSYMEFIFADLTSPSTYNVGLVKAYELDRDGAASGSNVAIVRVYEHNGGTPLNATPDVRLSTDDPGTTLTYRQKTLSPNSGSWTRSKVNDLRCRLGFGDNVPDAYFVAGPLLEVAMEAVDRPAHVAWAELEVPDATVDARADVSWAELEVPAEPSRADVSWTELEVPNEPSRADVSWTELEVPTPDSRADVSWAELETPTPDSRADVSWTELEVPTPDARADVSWAELEIPDAPVSGPRKLLVRLLRMNEP